MIMNKVKFEKRISAIQRIGRTIVINSNKMLINNQIHRKYKVSRNISSNITWVKRL